MLVLPAVLTCIAALIIFFIYGSKPDYDGSLDWLVILPGILVMMGVYEAFGMRLRRCQRECPGVPFATLRVYVGLVYALFGGILFWWWSHRFERDAAAGHSEGSRKSSSPAL